MKRILTVEQTEKVRELYKDTQMIASVKEYLSCDIKTVKRILKELDIPIRKTRGTPQLSIEKKIELNPKILEIVAAAQTHENSRAVAKEFGISLSQVNRYCRLTGNSIGKGKRNRRIPVSDESLIDLYHSGLDCEDIAKEVGVVQGEAIRRALKKNQVPRRKGGASGSKNSQWKGGKDQAVHYYRRQCYEIAAICLKHPVPKGQVIHHIDENKMNNDPNNLCLFPSAHHHARYHQISLNNQKSNLEVDSNRLLSECGGVMLPLPENLEEILSYIDHFDP